MIFKRIKELRQGSNISLNALAKELGISPGALSNYETGKRIPDAALIVKMSERFNVSTDYLLERSRAAAPDNLIQEVSRCYGLSESTLEFLERINIPLDIEPSERARITAKEKAFMKNPSETTRLTIEEHQALVDIQRDTINKQVLSALNDLLSEKGEWETSGFEMLKCVHDFCYKDFEEGKMTANEQLGLIVYELSGILSRLRFKLKYVNTGIVL